MPVSSEEVSTVSSRIQEIADRLIAEKKDEYLQGSNIAVIRQIGGNSYIKEYGDGRKEKIVFSKDSKIHDFYES